MKMMIYQKVIFQLNLLKVIIVDFVCQFNDKSLYFLYIIEPSKGEKRKRGTNDQQENTVENSNDDEDGPPHKI